jgi:hypothetical protein
VVDLRETTAQLGVSPYALCVLVASGQLATVGTSRHYVASAEIESVQAHGYRPYRKLPTCWNHCGSYSQRGSL